MTSSLARQIAHTVLIRVAEDDAYAGRILQSQLTRSSLDARDCRFVTELVYGTLRQQIRLDHILQTYLNKPIEILPLPVVVALRLGAYQLKHLDTPAHSAVDQSVSLVRSFGKLTGLVNAVLRKVASHDIAEPLASEPLENWAIALSHPAWLLKDIAKRYGKERAIAYAKANNQPAPVWLRRNQQRCPADIHLPELLAAHEAHIPLYGSPENIYLNQAGRIDELPGFQEGWFTVQDGAATLIGNLCEPQRNSTVLDMCAAPGSKSTHLADLMHNTGLVLALDSHAGRLQTIQEQAYRLGFNRIHTAHVDSANIVAVKQVLQQHNIKQVDTVLLDAPCSGLGTLRRHPELRYKATEHNPSLIHLQAQLLDCAAQILKSGGHLIYAVCTVTEAEGPQQIAKFLNKHPNFVLDAPQTTTWQPYVECLPQGHIIRTWTDLHGLDSFFTARLRQINS